MPLFPPVSSIRPSANGRDGGGDDEEFWVCRKQDLGVLECWSLDQTTAAHCFCHSNFVDDLPQQLASELIAVTPGRNQSPGNRRIAMKDLEHDSKETAGVFKFHDGP